MQYGKARNIYIGIISAIGFALFVNSLIHFDFSKTPETLILALYYFVAIRFEVFLFKKNCHYCVDAPLHLLSIMILGYQAAIPLVLVRSIINYYHWKRNRVSLLQGVFFGSLIFVPAIYIGNSLFQTLGGHALFNFNQIPYKAILEVMFFLLFYGFCLYHTLVAFPGDKRKIHLDFLFVDFINHALFPVAIMIELVYNFTHWLGLMLCLLPFAGLAYLFGFFIKRFFERDEFASALTISVELIESNLDLQSMTNRMAQKVRDIFEARNVEIFLNKNGFYILENFIGISPWDKVMPGEQFLVEIQNILPQTPATLHDSSMNLNFQSYKKMGIESLLIIPLVSRKEYIGFILCGSTAVFDPSYEFFAKKLIPFLSTALISAQLHECLAKTLKELREAKAQLIHFEKMASIGRLAAGIAHEFNTPLSTLMIKVEALKDSFTGLPENLGAGLLTETCSVLESQIGRLTGIVDGLHAFSKNEKLNETWSYVNLKEVIERVLEQFDKFLFHRVNVHLDFSEIPDLWCNPSQISQLFKNIISNALLAIQGDGNIWIIGFVEQQKLIISVRDNGSGIPKKDQNRIFDPFFTTREIGEGTGLGLSVAYGIMERHSGEISFESQEGVGTTFYLAFPQSQSLYVKI